MKSPNLAIHASEGNLPLLFLIATILITGACNKPDEQRRNSMPIKNITEVLEEHTQELMSIPGVVGLAQGLCHGKPCIHVYISEKTPEVSEKVPPFLRGYPVMVEKTGKIQALPKK